MTDCPAWESLERLLREELSGPEAANVAAHVEECAACQGTLHRLTLAAPGLASPHLVSALSATPFPGTNAEADAFFRRLRESVGTLGPGRPDRHASLWGEGWRPPAVEGYELSGELGRGAAAVVYRARHCGLDRPVALKMILDGPRLSPEMRRRFRLEALATARLRHPNIVQVYDVGECAGRPYLALELVEGGSLEKWLGGAPLPASEAARAVATLAGAVEYAHQRGVVHRDLKPSNVLLGGRPGSPVSPSGGEENAGRLEGRELKIADFGLAKVLLGSGAAEDRVTQSGVIVGTPAYMAPEQALGKPDEVGPGADVYALGAILYELLTGRPPFRGASAMATLLQAAHQEPEPPARLVPGLPRDLNTICLKCLEKDPRRRYSAKELAAELGRFLNRESLRTRPAGLLERGLRWLRRRPDRAAALAASLLLAVALVGAGLWLGWQRAATSAAVEDDLREAARLRDESAWAEAGAALERARGRLGQDGPGELRRRLDEAARDLDQARRDVRVGPRLDAIRLKRVTLAEGRFNRPAERRFNNAQADRDYEAAFREAGLSQVGGDPGDAAARVRASAVSGALVSGLDDWSACATDRGRQAWLLEVARRADPDAWRDRARDPAVWGDPAALAALAQAAPAAEGSASLLLALGERLRDLGGDATALLRRVQQAYPGDFWANLTLARALHGKGESEAAADYYAKALAVRPGAAVVLNDLGLAEFDQHLLRDSIKRYGQALQSDPGLAPAHNNLGLALKDEGQWDKAVEHYREALRLDPGLAPAHYNLGVVRAGQGGLDDAVGRYREALRLDPAFALAHYMLGVALPARERLEEAGDRHRQALRKDLKNKSSHDRDLGFAVNEALYRYYQALTFDPAWVSAYDSLGLTERDKGRLDEAVDHYQRAIQIDPSLARAHGALGQVLLAQGHFREARAATRRCLELLDGGEGVGDASIGARERANLATQLHRCEQFLALEGREAALQGGKDKPADAAEALLFADLCRFGTGRPAAVARLYADAFAAAPHSAEDLAAGHRYNAARAAALAGCGRGEGTAGLGEQKWARYRERARAWLRADLTAWAERLDRGTPEERRQVRPTLTHWRTDPALTGVHEFTALERLPPAERREWRALWDDVDALLLRAEVVK
jgi:serine/threonine-protein kinase